MDSTFRFNFIIFLLFSSINSLATKTIGPDLVARAKLLRDLPLGRTLTGQERVLPRNKERTLIELGLALRSLDMNFENGIFSIDGWMSLKWNDPRYAWDPADYEDISSMPLPFANAWAPEIILHNAVEEKFIYRQVAVVRYNGDFIYLISIHTKSSCAPNYSNFPFGLQTCTLKFGSWVNEQYKVEYRAGSSNVNTNSSAINLDEFNSPIGWQIVGTEARLESAQYPLFDEPSPMVVYTISFKRDFIFDQITGTIKRKEEKKPPRNN